MNVEKHATFAALRNLVVEIKEEKQEPSDDCLWCLEKYMILVDHNVINANNVFKLRSIRRYRPTVCIPEVVVDLLDAADHEQRSRTLGSSENRARPKILELQDEFNSFHFQRVDEYDFKFIEENNLQRKKNPPDHRLILAAAKYFNSHLKDIGAQKVVVLSDNLETQKLANCSKIPIFASVDALKESVRRGDGALNI